jgi:hypothetical protein
MTDDDGEWRFELEDLGEDGQTTRTVERESVSAENALFVAAGVVLTVGALVLLAL